MATAPGNPPHPINDPTAMDLSGSVYALSATGGFTMERGFDDIKFRLTSEPVYVDVTNSIQVMMDIATFESKLGAFDPVSDEFANDEITISAAEFKAGVTKGGQVISVGKYSTLYSDFQTYVATYFGFDGGFSSLFAAASEFAIDNTNVFNGDSFVSLLNGVSETPEGAYISDLSGSITISNINQLLRYAVDADVFGNRTPGTNGDAGAVDPNNTNNWGVEDGFVIGDLIWVEAGTKVTLKLDIDYESFTPINNIGVANTNSLTQSTKVESGLFRSTTSATTTNITRTVTAPLLIKLVAASTISAL
jgi:hypothetical protein